MAVRPQAAPGRHGFAVGARGFERRAVPPLETVMPRRFMSALPVQFLEVPPARRIADERERLRPLNISPRMLSCRDRMPCPTPQLQRLAEMRGRAATKP